MGDGSNESNFEISFKHDNDSFSESEIVKNNSNQQKTWCNLMNQMILSILLQVNQISKILLKMNLKLFLVKEMITLAAPFHHS